jgi:hypothetical protein
MAGFDVVVYGEFVVVDRAIPDFMIAFSGSIVAALVSAQDVFDLTCIARHLRRFRQANALLTLLCLAAEMEKKIDWLVGIGCTII